MTILLFGAEGQLGRELAVSLAALGPMTALCRSHVDLRTPLAAAAVIRSSRPQFVVNAAGYTNVDAAESEPELAQRINGDAVGEIAEACSSCGSHLLHFSTDYVFAGTGTAPHREEDPVGPVNAYGRSKLEGERQAMNAGCQLTILRTSWLHAPRGKNFIRTVLALAQTRHEISVVSDQVGAPTSARWLADIASHIARRTLAGDRPTTRVLHATSRGSASWHEVAQTALSIAVEAGMPSLIAKNSITPITSSQLRSPAVRPLNSRLSIETLESTLGIECQAWIDGVRETACAIARESVS